MKIYSYDKFKNLTSFETNRKYKKVCHDVQVNMYHNGFCVLDEYELEAKEKSLDRVNETMRVRDIIKGEIIYYRTKDLWGIPLLVIFYREPIK